MRKILMISLDNSILNPSSRAADRMREYGREQELFIVIPSHKKLSVQLSDGVSAIGTGGGKIAQFFRIVSTGRNLIREAGIEEITTQDPFYTGLAGFLIGTLLGGQAGKKVRLEVQLHGDFFSALGGTPPAGGGLATFVIRRADHIRTVGERVRQSLVRMGIPEEKIIVRPIAVNAEAIRAHVPNIDLHKKYPQFESIFLVLSRFDRIKNIPWLVDIFADVATARPRAGLIIVGSGADEKRIRRMVAQKGLKQSVIIEPWTDDPWSYMKTADALLFPSVSEGYGLAAMEAVAAELPVVMTDVGVAHYELQPGAKVNIVPVGDKQAFIQAILTS
jgi:glycosyltransferase involved in cell wall biosynthesis